MKNSKHIISVLMLFALGLIGVNAEAQRVNRITDRQVTGILQRLERSSNQFRVSLNTALISGRIDQTRPQNDINSFEPAFRASIDQFRDRFNHRTAVASDVQNILQKAQLVNGFMTRHRLNVTAQNNWAAVRTDLNALASAYRLSWPTANLPDAGNSQLPYNSNSPLTGTFRLDASRSDNPRDVADRAARNLSSNERSGISERMFARLESPQMLAIDRRGTTITMASTRAPQSTFEADGVERQEQLANGRTTRVTATLNGDQLTIRSTGYRENDFNVNFEPIENGRRLRITREIFSERLSQPILVNSIYDRTSDVAQWNLNTGSEPVLGAGTTNGEFILRDGETVIASLNNDLSTKQARQGDRFTMTVREA